jgi:hypothetical protein
MKIVEFYRGERANNAGHTLEEILTWSNGALEMDHDWVQWVFGSNERSMLNGEAPTLTKEESDIFKSDPELQEKVKQSFIRILRFLDFKLSKDGEEILIEPKDENVPWWIRGAFNHNMLRVTRILKCLRLTGNDRYAVAFFDALREFKDKLSTNTWGYYHSAVFEPLWPEVIQL